VVLGFKLQASCFRKALYHLSHSGSLPVIFAGYRNLGWQDFFVVLFLRQGSPCVAQGGLRLQILLPQPPECWITGMYHHAQLAGFFCLFSNTLKVLLTF
jgi:hypothetical protein